METNSVDSRISATMILNRMKKWLIILLLPLLAMQDIPTERRVMRKHDNGKEHVVLYFDKETDDLLKEEVFFPSGKLQWSGRYKHNVEHGTWMFYYPSGTLKTQETYANGKENGITTHYSESGKKVKEEHWKSGKLVKEVSF
jgi:antitoxin component YwqK of YwqJK toxin-antitoxin module